MLLRTALAGEVRVPCSKSQPKENSFPFPQTRSIGRFLGNPD
jgi:hypothetical protein